MRQKPFRTSIAIALAASLAVLTPATALGVEKEVSTQDALEASVGFAREIELDADAQATDAFVEDRANNEVASLFLDTSTSDWFAAQGYLDYVVDNDIIKGYGNGYFGPNDSISRAQFVTILWRIAGEPAAPANANAFSDVPADAYYHDAVLWASDQGITSGYVNPDTGQMSGLFGPDDPVTREQLATFIGRFAVTEGIRIPSADESELFQAMPDKDAVSTYATIYLAWCLEEGIMNGSVQENGTFLAPADNATRCQAAKMITVLRRDVLGMASLSTTQVQREELFLTILRQAVEEAGSTIDPSLGISFDSYLLSAESGTEHSYWVEVSLPFTYDELNLVLAYDQTLRTSWNDMCQTYRDLSLTLFQANESISVDVPVYCRINDENGVALYTARNGVRLQSAFMA